jgi:hypothetical protein
MLLSFPDLRNVQAQPGITAFRLGSAYELVIELDKATVKAHKPTDPLNGLCELADALLKAACAELRLSEFSRVGLRTAYVRDFDSTQSASDAFFRLGLLRVPPDPKFIEHGAPTLPEYTLRWEDEHLGAALRAKVDIRKYKLELPFGWEGNSQDEQEFHSLFFDVDYYTKTPVGVSQFGPSEWVAHAFRSVRRGAQNVFAGGS